MSKKNTLRVVSLLVFMLLALLLTYKSALAQPKDPCTDAEFLRLKALPKASLTESERKALNKLNADCERFKQQAESKQVQSPIANAPKQPQPSDTTRAVLKEEPFATTRNFTILGAMCAVVAGIIIALNSVAESPF